jgi:hypothetical protein
MFGTYFYDAHRILPPYQFGTNQIQGRFFLIGLKCTYVLLCFGLTLPIPSRFGGSAISR